MPFVSNRAERGRDVTFLTDDSVHIRGTYYEAQQPGEIALLLVHDFLANRQCWEPYIPAFLSRGWSLLSIDLRGHGESTRQDMRQEPLEPQDRDKRNPGPYPADVKAALGWLARQVKTDAGRIAAVGVGLGSDLVYAASGKGWGTASSVLIGLDEGRARELAGTGPFAPRSVYLILGSQDATSALSARNFLTTAAFPKDAFAYEDTAASGIKLYEEKHPEILARTIMWISKTDYPN